MSQSKPGPWQLRQGVRRLRARAPNGWSSSERCTLLLLRGKQGRCESPAGTIQDALHMVLDAAQVPCLVSVAAQVTPGHRAVAPAYPALAAKGFCL